MKLYHIAAVMLLGVATAATTSCGNGDADAKSDSTKNVQGTQMGDAYATNINIRYVDKDSLLAHYDFCIDNEKIVAQIDLELQQYQNQLARNLQSKQNAIQQKAQSNGYLTEASYKADVEEFQKLNQVSEAQMSRRAQADQQRVFELKKAYIDAIEAYIVEFNKKYKYDAILFKEAGLYFNPALDITKDVLTGLNAEYKAKKGAADKGAKPAEEAKK